MAWTKGYPNIFWNKMEKFFDPAELCDYIGCSITHEIDGIIELYKNGKLENDKFVDEIMFSGLCAFVDSECCLNDYSARIVNILKFWDWIESETKPSNIADVAKIALKTFYADNKAEIKKRFIADVVDLSRI